MIRVVSSDRAALGLRAERGDDLRETGIGDRLRIAREYVSEVKDVVAQEWKFDRSEAVPDTEGARPEGFFGDPVAEQEFDGSFQPDHVVRAVRAETEGVQHEQGSTRIARIGFRRLSEPDRLATPTAILLLGREEFGVRGVDPVVLHPEFPEAGRNPGAEAG